MNLILIILFSVIRKFEAYSFIREKEDCGLRTSGIYASVSKEGIAEEDDTVTRWIEAQWWGVSNYSNTDWVAVWDTDPRIKNVDSNSTKLNNESNQGINKAPLDSKWSSGESGGFKFKVVWNASLIPDKLDNMMKCMPYWVAYIQNGVIVHISCLRLRPNWMWNMKEALNNKTITEVVYPGSHENGYAGNLVHSAFYNSTKQWTLIHGLTLWQQLMLGARYFDYGIGYNSTSSSFSILHGSIPVMPLTTVLDDLVKFINFTNEIVIFSISNVDSHIETNYFLNYNLAVLLETTLKKWAIERSDAFNPQFSKLWQRDKRVLISYPLPSSSELIWDPNYNAWFASQRLIDFLPTLTQPVMEQVGNFTEMHSVFGTIDKPLNKNISKKAEIHTLTLRLQRNWCPLINILSADFFISTDIVSLAIEINNRFEQITTPLVEKETGRSNSEFTPCATNPSNTNVWPTLKATSDVIFGNDMDFRLIQINWIVDEVYSNDWVGVFNNNPIDEELQNSQYKIIPLWAEEVVTEIPLDQGTALENETILTTINPEETTDTTYDIPEVLPNITNGFRILFKGRPYSTKGLITSTVKFNRVKSSVLAKGGCVGPWVGYVRFGEVLDAQCIRSHPSWMWDNRDSLGNWSVSSLVIPGTHNSGSYSLNDTYDSVGKWVVCQDEDILSQLLYGVRYLDLRVGYYPDTPELLWINHDVVRWMPLKKVIDDIVAFVTYSPDPLIIDVHRTPMGFEEHAEAAVLLVSMLNSTLGALVLPSHFTSQVTLNQIWGTGRGLIISYGDVHMRRKNPWLWPPIRQEWADAQTLSALRKFLDRKMDEMDKIAPIWRPIWAAMGHLTPTLWDIILGNGKGVREMADRTGGPLTSWFRDRWATKANVITSDFFHSNNIIYLSIKINLMRSICPTKLHGEKKIQKKKKELVMATTLNPLFTTLFKLNQKAVKG